MGRKLAKKDENFKQEWMGRKLARMDENFKQNE